MPPNADVYDLKVLILKERANYNTDLSRPMSSTSTAIDGSKSTKAMTRKSQRLVKRAKANNIAGHVQSGTKLAIRKTGGHSQFMNMPMDILMEVFGHLHPLDLLHLARTTKAFRRFLMHRSSLFVWKAALSTIPGLPDCPPELSEPQWASLAFDACCSLCSCANNRKVDWVLRVRLCTTCAKQHITDWSEVSGYKYYPAGMTDAVPHRRGKFLRDECQKVLARCRAIKSFDARQAFVVEQQQLVKRIKEHAKLCIAWERDELDRLKSDRRQAIVDKLVALGWGDEIDKIPAFHDLKYHKLVEVPQLLTDEVWAKISGVMIQYMEQMKTNRLARETEKLRPQRLLDAVKLLHAYKTDSAPFTNVMPEPLDFCDFAPVKQILDQPPDVNVDSESFLHLMPDLDGLVEEWRRTIIQKFIKQVKAGVVTHSNTLDSNPLSADTPDESIAQRIQLACTVFTCAPCRKIRSSDAWFAHLDLFAAATPNHPITSRCLQMKLLWYPRVLGHYCLTKPRGWGSMGLNLLPCYRQAWSCKSMIKVDEEACKAAAAVIEACEMDPRAVTVDEMDQLDARLECLACLVPGAEDPSHVVFGWRSAVKHQCERHPSDLGDWRMLTACEAQLARVEEGRWESIRVTPKVMAPSDLRVWLCLHCLDGPAEQPWATLEVIRHHLQDIHGVGDPEVDRDYVKDFAAPEVYATSTLFKAAVVKFPAHC